MPAEWTIRRAGMDDAARLALVGAATFLDAFAGILDGDAIVSHCARVHNEQAYRAVLDAGAVAWLAETTEGDAPVGFALLADAELPGAEAGDIELKRVYALSRFHGSGLGAALMAKAVDEAHRRGAARLLLGVYKDNGRALAFYARSGFTRVAERSFRVGARDYDDWVLARPVSAP